MNLEQVLLLLGPLVQLVTALTKQIIESVNMTEEQKQEALKLLQQDLDATVQKVKSVRFEAISKGNQTP